MDRCRLFCLFAKNWSRAFWDFCNTIPPKTDVDGTNHEYGASNLLISRLVCDLKGGSWREAVAGRRERNFWMQRQDAQNQHKNARAPTETKIQELSSRKSPQKRPIWRTIGNVRFAETGWWAHQGSNLGPDD